jgi:hypothetical protein
VDLLFWRSAVWPRLGGRTVDNSASSPLTWRHYFFASLLPSDHSGGDILTLSGAVILPDSNCSSSMSNIRWVIETLVLGSFLGSLLLALTKNIHPERTGLINRWHYFFWYFLHTETHSPGTDRPDP